MNIDKTKLFNFEELEERVIDLDFLDIQKVKFKYKNITYKINIEKFLEEFGCIESITFNNN